MTETIARTERQLMPGSFSPEDYIDFYENPFDTSEEITSTAVENRSSRVPWSSRNLEEVQIGDVDWHKYDPPASLRKAPNITNQVLVDILYSSIENVKTRIAEEDRLKREAAELEVQDGKSIKLGNGTEPYLPIIIPREKSQRISKGKEPEVVEASGALPDRPTFDETSEASKTEKRRKFALRRIFQRSHARGESSAAGSAREALRQLYESRQSNEGGESFSKRKSAEVELVECVSCLDDFNPKEVIKVQCHSYCKDCFVRLITAAVQNEQQWPPKCCLNEIPFRVILKHIPADLKKTFQARSQEWEIPLSERIYCTQADCGLWVKPKDIHYANHYGRCSRGHQTCTICRGPRHAGDDCPEDNDMYLTNQLAEEEGWRRCYSCNALVEHKEACQHMTCRCGSQFCYVCGQRWRTCTCTMEQLNQIKSTAETRREQRRLKEHADAEELREALRLIEEFEREEALKEELLRLERERLEEERQQRELEERVRQESIRRQDVELKYVELRQMLDQLHELQQVLVEVDQEHDTEILAQEAKTKKDSLTKKHEEERSSLGSLSMTKLTDKEFGLEKEYQIRAAEENDIEEAYADKLKEFWKDKTGGDNEIEAAMLTLRRTMDERQRAWQEWKKDELSKYQSKLDEERCYREELMYSEEHRMNDAYFEKEAELGRRIAAEKMWLQVVILEREKLLGQWEVLEVEGDADSLFAEGSEKKSFEVA